MNVDAIAVACRILVAGIFCFAGSRKIFYPAAKEHAMLLREVGLRESSVLSLAIRSLPAAEVFLGMWLLTGLFAKIALLTAVVLLMTFSALAGLAWRNGYQGGCSCLGRVEAGAVGGAHLLVNFTLIIAGVSSFVLSSTGSPDAMKPVWHVGMSEVAAVAYLFAIFVAIAAMAYRMQVLWRASGGASRV